MHRLTRIVLALLLLAIAVAGAQAEEKKFSINAVIEANEGIEVVADATASKLDKPQVYVPIAIVVRNLQKQDIVISHQSFAIGSGDQRFALAPYGEFDDDYHHVMMDLRMEETFIQQVGTYYQGNPKIPLQFFPNRTGKFSPRDSLVLEKGNVAYGFIYFKLPAADALGAGDVTLYVTPAGMEQLPVEITIYKQKKK